MPKNFDVTISVAVTGDGAQFSNYTLNYHNLGYASLQALQHAITEALLALGDAKLPAADK